MAAAAERKLKTRRRRASKGRHFRVSDLVYGVLDRERRGRSWDCFMRDLFGLPDRSGAERPLIEGMLEVHSGTFILKAPGVPWPEAEAIAARIAATLAKKPKLGKWDLPVRMREVR